MFLNQYTLYVKYATLGLCSSQYITCTYGVHAICESDGSCATGLPFVIHMPLAIFHEMVTIEDACIDIYHIVHVATYAIHVDTHSCTYYIL